MDTFKYVLTNLKTLASVTVRWLSTVHALKKDRASHFAAYAELAYASTAVTVFSNFGAECCYKRYYCFH
jgi:hypothetical protein